MENDKTPTDRKTRRQPLSALTPNAANPRSISKEKIDRLVESLLIFPQMLDLRPIVVDGRNTVLGGNMRLRALGAIAQMTPEELADRLGRVRGYKSKKKAEKEYLQQYWAAFLENPAAPVVNADGLTDAQVKEFIIKDNIAFGSWDWDELANGWDSEDLADWGLDVWQEAGEVESEGKATAFHEDEFDESDKVDARCKTGDIWILGEHRLMCADSTSSEAFASLMAGEKADMVFTDPPYGVAIGDKNKILNEKRHATAIEKNIANDNIGPEALFPILVKAMTNCRLNCKDDASYFVTSPQGGELGLMMMMMMKESGLPVRHMLIWMKNNATFSLGRLDYDYQHEPIFYTWTKSHHNYRAGKYRTTIWQFDRPSASKLHPTMKPVALVCNCLLDTTKEGDIVLDAFGGSGTTLIACEELGRKARLMEIDPHYCDVIISRWEKHTGKTATQEAE